MVQISLHTLTENAINALSAAQQLYNRAFDRDIWLGKNTSASPLLMDGGYMKDLGHAFKNVDKELPNNLPSAIGVLRYNDRSVIVENIPVGTLDSFTLPQPNQMLEPSNFAVNYIMASGLNFDNTPQATLPGIWKRSLRSGTF